MRPAVRGPVSLSLPRPCDALTWATVCASTQARLFSRKRRVSVSANSQTSQASSMTTRLRRLEEAFEEGLQEAGEAPEAAHQHAVEVVSKIDARAKQRQLNTMVEKLSERDSLDAAGSTSAVAALAPIMLVAQLATGMNDVAQVCICAWM